MKLKSILITIVMVIAGIRADASIPIAGIYEGADKNLAASRNMYVVLDFINGTPDFTQQFKTKESTFKVLPKDFMNAGKISKAFAGTRAPGFSRYRSKVLFANWEEMKIMNPRLKKGIVICDWVDTYDRKGKCVILRLPGDSITIYGLSSLDPSIGPDGLRLELVKSLLPAGTQQLPQLTSEAIADIRKEISISGVTPFINKIDNLPTSESVNNEPSQKPITNQDSSESTSMPKTSSMPLPVLWRDNGPTMYEYKAEGDAGSYGPYEVRASLDFWGDATVVRGQDVVCREYIIAVYGTGRRNESEYIYYGHEEDNKVVFTHRYDSLAGGYHNDNPKIEKLETPLVLTSPDGNKLDFNGITYVRTY